MTVLDELAETDGNAEFKAWTRKEPTATEQDQVVLATEVDDSKLDYVYNMFQLSHTIVIG